MKSLGRRQAAGSPKYLASAWPPGQSVKSVQTGAPDCPESPRGWAAGAGEGPAREGEQGGQLWERQRKEVNWVHIRDMKPRECEPENRCGRSLYPLRPRGLGQEQDPHFPNPELQTGQSARPQNPSVLLCSPPNTVQSRRWTDRGTGVLQLSCDVQPPGNFNN